jgi:putative glutathione S-transferase
MRICDPHFFHYSRIFRFTVPVLWDKKHQTIVNNESSEIIRIFNTAFNGLVAADKASLDLYPESLRTEIDSINDWVYTGINSQASSFSIGGVCLTPHFLTDGVYRSGFATTQEAYQHAVVELFESLDKVEKILTGKDYLVGDTLTEADVRLFVTIVSVFYPLSQLQGSDLELPRFDLILSMLVTSSAIFIQSEMDIRLSTR